MSDASGAVLRGAIDLSSLKSRPVPTAAGGDGTGGVQLVREVTQDSFQQILELSRVVPVIVDLYVPGDAAWDQVTATLDRVVREAAGRLVLAKVDVQAEAQIAQAFGVAAQSMAIALVAGQPVPLFNDVVDESQIIQVLSQLLQLAAQNGVTGAVTPTASDETPDAEAEAELPPLHQEAFAAIEAGDYARAAAAYEQALEQNPRDEQARAGLGQVRLLERVQGEDLQAARAAAADAPLDIAAQFRVADLDISGGHVDDAFGRLLELFAALSGDERTPVRERLVELFGLVGEQDPRVARARQRLTSLLF